MKHDTKVGLGLGILLSGIATAFYCRTQPIHPTPLPELQPTTVSSVSFPELMPSDTAPISSLEDFERKYRPDLKLEEIESSKQFPEVELSHHGQFDREFGFLNDPPLSSPAVDKAQESSSSEVATSDNTDADNFAQDNFEQNATIVQPEAEVVETGPTTIETSEKSEATSRPTPTQAIVSSKADPPQELPDAAEMFSEDLQDITKSDPANDLIKENIPIELEPIVVETPTAQIEKVESRPKRERDPRVIVPKRVRLNEPIRAQIGSRIDSPGNSSANRQNKRQSSTATDSDAGALPSLKGLEPLDPNQ